ncbi:hypothetical protein JAAARDRAFT_36806 [Jaapia argillacea MUCL 33604]|uniref:Uncharacterized protein n=1 Tax=Jaapia argillacea MUCL 33604 TaxID=933084 RepID=A0A067Q084_9AGAM|nr:hypothetical protein JAAARDRAFT_36806 [Jaapia argillacea MUCL 33604]
MCPPGIGWICAIGIGFSSIHSATSSPPIIVGPGTEGLRINDLGGFQLKCSIRRRRPPYVRRLSLPTATSGPQMLARCVAVVVCGQFSVSAT